MEKLSEEPKRNVRAEWEALQEYAKGENFARKTFERHEEDPERKRKQEIGRRLLEAVELLSERADDEKLEGRIDRAMKMAERAGIREDAERSMKFHMTNDFDSPAKELERAERDAQRKGDVLDDSTERNVSEIAERLRESAIELKGADLSGEFPSGNYLFHSATVGKVEQILASGKLMNAQAIMEQSGVSAMEASANSGGEGISWSMNGIDALPGTRGHIAGFLAAPEAVLGDEKLVVPSRPAPYEMLQVSEGMDAKAFFEAKKQVEVWGDRCAKFSDLASVDTNLIFLGMADSHFATSQMDEFLKRGGMLAEELRKHYALEEDGVEGDSGRTVLRLDEQLHQQKDDEKLIPPGAVYLQSLIDRGMVKEILGASEETDERRVEEMDVNELIELLKKDGEARKKVIRAERAESQEVLERYDAEWEKARGIEVPVSEMYFVCSHKDLPAWARMMAKAEVQPKGILLYDDKQVVLPNFATAHLGNHAELTQEINGAVKVNSEFWREEMGMDVESLERVGSQGQVLREEDARHDRELKMVEGKLTLTA